jgi:hypothetical protein
MATPPGADKDRPAMCNRRPSVAVLSADERGRPDPPAYPIRNLPPHGFVAREKRKPITARSRDRNQVVSPVGRWRKHGRMAAHTSGTRA